MFPDSYFPRTYFAPVWFERASIEVEILPISSGGGRIGLGKIGRTFIEVLPDKRSRIVTMTVTIDGELYSQSINMDDLVDISVEALSLLIEKRLLKEQYAVKILRMKTTPKRFK